MLPCIYLATDQLPKAREAVLQLLARSAKHERLPHAIHEIVEQAEVLGKTLQAGQICQNILTAQPDHPQAIWLKMGIAVANAHLGDDQAVDAVLQDIIAHHAPDERAAEALGQTAWAYRKLAQPDKARKIYQYVVDNWPSKDRAIFSQRGIVLCSIAMNDQVAAAAGVQKLLTGFAGDAHLPETLAHIAEYQLQRRNLEDSRQLYQYIVDQYPEHEIVTRSTAKLAQVKILQGDDNAAGAILHHILADYANSPKLAEAVRLVGEGYYVRAMAQLAQARKEASPDVNLPRSRVALPESALQDHRKAIEILEMVIHKPPPKASDTPNAYHVAAESYKQIGQPQKAIEYYQQLCDNWPNYEYAWHVQYLIGRTYENLKELGTISPSEADPKIKAAYEQILAKYPTSRAAQPARDRLARYAQLQQGGEK